MECKKCGMPLEENDKFCKECGTPVGQKKNPVWKVILAAVGVALLGLGLAFVILLSVLGWPKLSQILGMRPNDIHAKDEYLVSNEQAAKAADKVVARVGDRTLTNSKLQVYYWMTVLQFIQNNQYYLGAMELDYTRPLADQTCYYDKDLTWEQYFLDNALQVWGRYAAMNIQADEENHEISSEDQAMLDSLPETLQELVTLQGYATVEELVAGELGAACTLDGYMEYWDEYYTNKSFFTEKYNAMIPTTEEIESYFQENETALGLMGISKDMGRYIDVRHILIVPESAKEYGSAAYITCPQEEWDSALQEAERILEEWKAGEATSASFGALAEQYSVDPGSNTNGGLYQKVEPGDMVAEFDDWINDPARVEGDTGIVKTSHGYHIMYEDKIGDLIWPDKVASYMLDVLSNALVENAVSKWPIEVTYKNIVISQAKIA